MPDIYNKVGPSKCVWGGGLFSKTSDATVVFCVVDSRSHGTGTYKRTGRLSSHLDTRFQNNLRNYN